MCTLVGSPAKGSFGGSQKNHLFGHLVSPKIAPFSSFLRPKVRYRDHLTCYESSQHSGHESGIQLSKMVPFFDSNFEPPITGNSRLQRLSCDQNGRYPFVKRGKVSPHTYLQCALTFGDFIQPVFDFGRRLSSKKLPLHSEAKILFSSPHRVLLNQPDTPTTVTVVQV